MTAPPLPAPVAISLHACAKTWPDGSRALHPVDLEVQPGEILALLGPSGCGKTTLLRLIAGLEQADAGATIRFDGQDVSATPPESRGVGVVFQSYALFPNMSVIDNVAYGLRVRGMALAERLARARQMLALVHLDAFAERSVAQLSGGQRQRVALARALAIEPRVLLLDEPLTALDAKLREHLRVELAQMLRELGITTIIVTHDQDEAMMLGHRIAVMSAGRIEQIGSAEALYREPATEFVAGFLGSLCTLQAAQQDGLLIPGGQPLAFRPHEAELVAPAPQGLNARIVTRFFLGDALRFELAFDDGQRASITAPADAPHQAGQQVGLKLARLARPVVTHV